MPTYSFSTLAELTQYIIANIATNGNEEISGQKHQDVLVSTAWTLLNLANSVPPSTVNQFPAWSNATVYDGGIERIVSHAGALWLFVSATDNTGTTPGTNELVWRRISSSELAHIRNQDQFLDFGGPFQVSAQEIRAMVTGENSSWIRPINNALPAPTGSEVDGTRYIVSTGATGAFAGHDKQIAERVNGVWEYTDPIEGLTVQRTNNAWLYKYFNGTWSVFNFAAVPNLTSILAASDASSRLIMAGSVVRTESFTYHTTAGGTYNITGLLGNLKVALGEDVVITHPGVATGTELVLVLLGSGSTRNITWTATKFSALTGLTLPATIAAGAIHFIRFIAIEGRLCAVNSALVQNV